MVEGPVFEHENDDVIDGESPFFAMFSPRCGNRRDEVEAALLRTA